jgi:aryl-alcohol dehydrogenase-like predicted oxidoreductase
VSADIPPAAAAGDIAVGNFTVNRIGLGARFIQDAEHSRPLLRRALELGVSLIDTADIYGNSENALAEALHPYPDGLVIATKGGQTHVDGQVKADGTPRYLREACERSLARLRVDAIDLYQLHMPDPNVPLAESLGALEELRGEGKIRHIGVSNVFGDQLELALRTVPLASVQNRYSLMHPGGEHAIEVCERERIAFMPWWPLGGGELTRAGGALAEVAAAHGATPAQTALAWLLQRSPAMLPIPGTGSIEHLEENVAAARVRLTAAEMAALDADAKSE